MAIGSIAIAVTVAQRHSRAADRRLTGAWKVTPFFDPETLEPVSEVYVLSRDERAAATPAPG